MENLRKDLELIEVTYENENKKAILTFLDLDKGEVLSVNFNKQSYDSVNNKYVDDEEKDAKVEEWSKKYFSCAFNKLGGCLGVKKDVYAYDTFNSLWEVEQIEKFDMDLVGQIFETKIEDITVDDIAIRIKYKIDDVLYETKMTYANYVDTRKEWFKDPIKKKKQYKKFEDKFHVSVENAKEIIGKSIMVEVKKAFNKFTYGDIKKLPKPTK